MRPRARHRWHVSLYVMGLVVVMAACTGPAGSGPTTTAEPATRSTTVDPAPTRPVDTIAAPVTGPLASIASGAITVPRNVYAGATTGHLSATAARARPLVYVPSNDDSTVAVIDQKAHQEIARYPVGAQVQHVVPSRTLDRLYANASGANQLVPFNPITGKPGAPIPVAAPYNLHFTPDGTRAVVMPERLRRIDYYDPTTWKLQRSVSVPCRGINHADWSADLTYFIVTCEFSGQLVKLDNATGNIIATVTLKAGAMPQDIRLSPDGTKFYIADMMNGGLWTIDGNAFTITGFVPTGAGTHGIYPSRDATHLYISNRGHADGNTTRRSRPGEGTITVIDPTTDHITATWTIPGGGSPDMGGVTADGTELWLSGRYHAVIYVFDTTTGAFKAKIPTVHAPHGLAVFPQPGTYSLGHTGNYR